MTCFWAVFIEDFEARRRSNVSWISTKSRLLIHRTILKLCRIALAVSQFSDVNHNVLIVQCTANMKNIDKKRIKLISGREEENYVSSGSDFMFKPHRNYGDSRQSPAMAPGKRDAKQLREDGPWPSTSLITVTPSVKLSKIDSCKLKSKLTLLGAPNSGWGGGSLSLCDNLSICICCFCCCLACSRRSRSIRSFSSCLEW